MKRILRAVLCAALCLAMLLSLAACGGKSGENDGKAEETPAPEYVYTAEFSTLEGNSLTAAAVTDEGFYAYNYEKIGENIPEGVTPEYEGEYDVYAQRLYFVGFDGSRKPLEQYADIDVASDHENSETYSYIQSMCTGPDGTLYAAVVSGESWNEAPESVEKYSEEYYMYNHYTETGYLRVLNADGSERSCVELDTSSLGYPSFNSMVIDADGNALCATDMGLVAFNPAAGTVAYTLPTDNWIEKLLRLKDGSVGALCWGDKGMEVLLVDMEKHVFRGDKIQLGNANTLFDGGGEYDFYYSTGTNFYGYDAASATGTKLFNWIGMNINPNRINSVTAKKNGQICVLTETWDSNYENATVELATLTKVPYDPSMERKVLTLATVWLNNDTYDRIISFNRGSRDCRIEVADYSEYNTEEDYSAGITKLTTEIMAGKLPDLIDLSQLPYESLAEKGVLEDLYPYIDRDSELSKEDFFPNVLGMMEVGGGLYTTVGSFSLMTVIGASSVVGDTPGWTYADLNAALATMPEGCEPFDYYTTRNDILNTCLSLDMDSFVDWTTGKCSFDSQDFIDLLEYCKQFPAQFDWENYDWESAQSDFTRITEGKQMLVTAYLSSYTDLPYYTYYFGGDYTFIGYPTSHGVGSMLSLSGMDSFGMTTACKDKDAAWQFLRWFFTGEYQDTLYMFPSRLDSYAKMEEKAMTPEYEKDYEGNFVLDENGEKIPIAKMEYSTVDQDGTEHQFAIYATTEEEAARIRTMIESTTRRAGSDEEISKIVAEEAEAFFAGQKSAAEVAKLIQSKVTIYVNEKL